MIYNFKVWFSKLKNFSPKIILLYVGPNDLGISPNWVPDKNILEAEHQRFDLTKRITFYGNIILFNIAIALYMGFKEIYLINIIILQVVYILD